MGGGEVGVLGTGLAGETQAAAARVLKLPDLSLPLHRGHSGEAQVAPQLPLSAYHLQLLLGSLP